MAVPFRRTSKTKKRMRRTHIKVEVNNMVKCAKCGELIRPHRVCNYCGFYKGNEIIEKDKK